MAPKKKNIFGGKSLSELRKSIGLDKDKSRASTTEKERDKNLPYNFQKDTIKSISDPEADPSITTAEGVAYSLDRGDFKPNFKAQETASTFVKDLKDAYKSGLFTGGTKTKALMDKYNLDSDDIVKLRTGIDQGLGIRMGTGSGNVLKDVVSDLRNEGILSYSDTRGQALYDKALDIFQPGMTKYDREPMTGILGMAPLVNLGITGMDLIAGGSDRGLKGIYYGKKKGLTGDELENFAAAVANDEELFRQMMTTDEMQDYQIEKFRTDTIKEAMDKRRKDGDPDPISNIQTSEETDEGTSTTAPGSETFTPQQQQNFFTFFDPSIGRYRSGSYDEYLKFVTAKDGGIIKLQQGEALPNAPGGVASEKVKKELDELFDARKEIQELDAPTESEKKGAQMIMSDIDDKAKAISERAQEGIMSRLKDQSAREIFMANNPDIGPPLREDLKLFSRVGDSIVSLFLEAIRKGDITEGSANQYLEEALNNFVAAGIIPPNTTYGQLTDPFKDLVTKEAAMIAQAESKRQQISMRGPTIKPQTAPYFMQEGQREEFDRINPIFRGIPVQEQNAPKMLSAADGGIIGLKKGGMNDMMDADSLMFKDPSDEGEWEYNV